MRYDLCIIGGAGHVGLPLGVAFANAGVKTVLCDINRASLEKIRRGVFPFKEEGGPRLLRRALKRGTLAVSETPDVISGAEKQEASRLWEALAADMKEGRPAARRSRPRP